MKYPTLCLDFDGVIHSYISGWKGASCIPDPPVPGAIKFIEDAQLAGWSVCIYSSRSKYIHGRRAMKRYVESHIIEYFGVDCVAADDCFISIGWPWFKPNAFITIDDRAYLFDGSFPDPKELLKFKPWYKKTIATL